MKEIEKKCSNATEGLKNMDKKYSACLEDLSERTLSLEQYLRKNSALLHGYKHLPNLSGLDFIMFVVDELNRLFPSLRGRVLPIHIDDAHPLKTKNNRPNNKIIIVKFANRWVKHDIMRCESDLKWTPFSVTEHLTPHTLKLLSLAGNLVGKANVCTFKTMVYATCNDMKYLIKNFRDLKSLECIVNNESHVVDNLNTDQSIDIIKKKAETDRAKYMIDYPTIYDSLLQNNDNSSLPLKGIAVRARGRPSRYGRGRGHHY